MSTIHSTPPIAGQRPHPVEFNDQAYYDPFFPSSPSDEHLVPVNIESSSSYQSYHSPSSQQESKSQEARASNTYDLAQQPPRISLSNGYNSTPATYSNTYQEAADSSYAFLSPSLYPSENDYNASSEHTATPEYGDGFYLMEDYDLLDDSNQALEQNNPAALPNGHPSQPSVDLDSPHNSNSTHRTSVGAATLSSHLMSPVLTDPAESGSRRTTASPPMVPAYFNNEGSHVSPPVLNGNIFHQANLDHKIGQMQRTPTTTESSKGTSPDMTHATLHTVRAASPVVLVESYSRGDSPARSAELRGRSGVKRSRAESRSSSYLAVQNNDESSEDDDENDGDRYNVSTRGIDSTTARNGLGPEARSQVNAEDVPNFKDQEESTLIALKNADVEEWLEHGASGEEDGAGMAPRRPATDKRQRARSAGAQSLSHANIASLSTTMADSHIPGPGVLVHEESEEDGSDMDGDEVASIENSPPPTTAMGDSVNEVPGEAKPGVYDELPDQPPLYRAKLWQDPLYDSSDPGVKMQPVSSNDAMRRFQERAGDLETLSRVATWGTRRLSESDLHSLFHGITLDDTHSRKPKRDRSGSFFQQAAAKLIPRRHSTLKRQESEGSKAPQTPTRRGTLEHMRDDSSGSHKESLGVPWLPPKGGLQRIPSLGKRPKSPRINTSVAVAAMTSQIAALGGSGSVSATTGSSPTGPWAATKNVIKRSRSRSDISGLGLHAPKSSSATELGLADLWTRQGGPPMFKLAPPKCEETTQQNGFGDLDDEDEDDTAEDHGVTMDLSIRPDLILPTLDGFKSNIRQLNPRLPPFMFDRIAQEQLRRFKKLMDFKIKHAQALSTGNCGSGKHCTELGGEPTYLPSKSSSKEPELSHGGFSVAGLGHSDEDVNALAEGIVTAAQFPPGVPMPPVKRLPAEFECSLCFKVKKFHKPSDWSKHVHEDVQPFTCTFGTCAEPKSFKRKADWVRHENERHRQLEWWMCNMNDCAHKCYRKDNFVQHLVREHKLPEPKVKTTKAGKPAVRGPSSQKARNAKQVDDHAEDSDEVDQVWKLVEECRHETRKNPKDEACKFCGNICNSWKKLTVHLAKHMEQISMPVLAVVKQKDVTPETIISPIEQRIASQQASISPSVQSPFSHSNSVTPYGVPASTMGEFRTGFTSLQPPQAGYFNGISEQPSIEYQRVSPHTYPPPTHAQQLAASYARSRGSPYPASDFSSYSSSPAPQFHPVNAQRGLPLPQSTSPDNLYTGMRAPTSQPRSSPYDEPNSFQYVPQQQATFTSPIEGSLYQFGDPTSNAYSQQTTPPISYPQQGQLGTPSPSNAQSQAAMGAAVPMQYNMNPMPGLLQANDLQNGVPNAYGQQQQQQQQQQHAFAYQQ